jgi:tetratricopeptide (TPR) repeat protein
MCATPARPGRWRCLCTAVAATLVAASGAIAQPVSPPPVSTWTRAVDAYLAGDDASAILELSPGEVKVQSKAALEAWRRAVRGGTPAIASMPGRTGDTRRLAVRRAQASAALLVETLVRLSAGARLLGDLSGLEEAASDAWDWLADVDQLGLQDADRERLRDFRQWWQVALLQYLLDARRDVAFQQLRDRIRPAGAPPALQAEYHLLVGMHEESRSRLVVGTAPRRPGDRDMSMGGRSESRLRVLTLSLDTAERAYRKALEAVPDHEEARLHFGRVAVDRKHPKEALTRLAPLLRSPCTTVTCGLAALFTGEAHEQLGALDEATRAYAQASSVADVRQSALLALMQASIRRGELTSGARLSVHFAADTPLGRARDRDAWNVYLAGQRPDAEPLLQSLRGAILR